MELSNKLRDVDQHRLRSLLSCTPNWALLRGRTHHPISSLVGLVVDVHVAARARSCATLSRRRLKSALMRHARLRAQRRARSPSAAHVGIGFAGPHPTGKRTWSRSPAPQARYRASRRPWPASEPPPLTRISSLQMRGFPSMRAPFHTAACASWTPASTPPGASLKRYSLPSRHIACMITASRRATAIAALFRPLRFWIFIPHAFSVVQPR